MEEVMDILRGIGVSEEHLLIFKEVSTKFILGFMIFSIVSSIMLPLLFIPLYFEMQGNNSLFIPSLYLWVIPFALAGGYFQFVLLKVSRMYTKLIEKTWAIWIGENIWKERKILLLMEVNIVEIFLLFFALWYISGGIHYMIFGILFLILIPALNFVAREKAGYTINHLFKGNVDEITDKLTILLNGKKKLLIKSQSSMRYMIEFQNPYNFKLFVFRRSNIKGFVEVSIAGVKLENVAAARDIVSEIEALLTQQ